MRNSGGRRIGLRGRAKGKEERIKRVGGDTRGSVVKGDNGYILARMLIRGYGGGGGGIPNLPQFLGGGYMTMGGGARTTMTGERQLRCGWEKKNRRIQRGEVLLKKPGRRQIRSYQEVCSRGKRSKEGMV